MPKALKFVLVVLGAFSVLFVALDVYVRSMPHVKEVAEFTDKFEKIHLGESKTKVIALLGEPHEQSLEFRLGQEKGFEEAYKRARKSNASYYLFWFRGTDVVFAVGFNDKDEVVTAESGGT
jgi:hypothetical protein